ncbi:MAG: hypothetical protein NVSMB28_29040 [Collimonas sp.]
MNIEKCNFLTTKTWAGIESEYNLSGSPSRVSKHVRLTHTWFSRSIPAPVFVV